MNGPLDNSNQLKCDFRNPISDLIQKSTLYFRPLKLEKLTAVNRKSFNLRKKKNNFNGEVIISLRQHFRFQARV